MVLLYHGALTALAMTLTILARHFFWVAEASERNVGGIKNALDFCVALGARFAVVRGVVELNGANWLASFPTEQNVIDRFAVDVAESGAPILAFDLVI